MNKNDEQILKLKEKIESKKEELKKVKRFSPITNCVIDVDGNDKRTNIQVLSEGQLKLLLIKLNLYRMSAENLGIVDVSMDGYGLEEWITDVKAKLIDLERKQEEINLRNIESKLVKLLSEDKKTELEISKIASLLNL